MSTFCAKCGEQFSIHDQKVTIDGVDYHERCANAAGAVKTHHVLVDPSPEQVQSLILKKLTSLDEHAANQTHSLKSINTILTVFIVLFLIGVVIQGCAAIL